jgi:hypothetical protein
MVVLQGMPDGDGARQSASPFGANSSLHLAQAGTQSFHGHSAAETPSAWLALNARLKGFRDCRDAFANAG